MKKKIIIAIILTIFLAKVHGLAWSKKIDFLSTAVSCGISTTLVNATGFNSAEINATFPPPFAIAALTVIFTRTTGTAAEVDFEFQVSYDGGTTWSTAYYVKISVPTNETAVSNVVRVTKEVQFYGISHVRLYRIVNNDGATALTACNATLSY